MQEAFMHFSGGAARCLGALYMPRDCVHTRHRVRSTHRERAEVTLRDYVDGTYQAEAEHHFVDTTTALPL